MSTIKRWAYRVVSRASITTAVFALVLPSVLDAQQNAPRAGANAARQPSPSPTKPTTPSGPSAKVQPPTVERTEPLSATVIEVEGLVDWARGGVSPLESKGWTPVQLQQQLTPGSQIRTGLRSQVTLQFGQTTTIALRSATHAGLDQLYRSATTETVRIGLGYGTVRGGSSEGAVRSDVRVESTVATLAKRGTEGWEMTVEPMTGRFRISLAEYGLVEAVARLRGAGRSSRTVRPGEYATDANIASLWIKQDIFDRNVQFYEASAVSVADADFTSSNQRGYGVVSPGGGATLADSAGRVNSDFVLQQTSQNFPNRVLPNTTVIVPDVVRRPDGNFGTPTTFRVLVPQGTPGVPAVSKSPAFVRP